MCGCSFAYEQRIDWMCADTVPICRVGMSLKCAFHLLPEAYTGRVRVKAILKGKINATITNHLVGTSHHFVEEGYLLRRHLRFGLVADFQVVDAEPCADALSNGFGQIPRDLGRFVPRMMGVGSPMVRT